MAPPLGFALLMAAFLTAAYGVTAAFCGAVLRHHPLVRSAERSAHALLWLVAGASLCLFYCFWTRDFSVEYVAQYSSRTLPTLYTISGFWAGQSGSLLFWLLILCGYSSAAVLANRSQNRILMPYVTGTLLALQLFFVVLLAFAANPFATLPSPPADGRGLNPVLQHPAMAIHPPMLFMGYVGLSVPFAFAIASLLTGKMDNDWIRSVRRWTLFAWMFLTAGITLGGRWAYDELGWGGYWGWDPVENASFMPWLLATAFLHSIMIQERRDMLKIWNVALIFGAFLLTVLGTFITRSGIISSVHSFAFSEVGPFFVGFLTLSSAVCFGLMFYRFPGLRARDRLESALSREGSFLLNNVLFLAIAFAVLTGTLWPIISEAVQGVKVTVGPPFFNFVIPPLALALLILTGVCPLIAWRKTTLQKFLLNLRIPGAFFVLSLAVMRLAGMEQWYANVFLSSCVLVLVATAMEFYYGARARQEMAGEGCMQALWNLFRRNGRRYGGYLVHVGVVVAFVGMTCSNAFQQEAEAVVPKGGAFQADGFTFVFREVKQSQPNPDVTDTVAVLDIFRGEKPVRRMHPAVHFYRYWDQPSTEVSVHATALRDIYVILVAWSDDGGQATFRVFINPLVSWFWAGVLLMVLGGAVAMLPRPHSRSIPKTEEP